jgi:PAS domain S-box-containing protein
MSSKPTYEELEQRVKKLEQEAFERRRVEEALLESEERFRTAFEDAATGIALMANDGYFMQVNQTLCRILGYSEEELLGKTWVEITEPDDRDGCFDWLKRVKAGEQSAYEKRFIHKLGHSVWVMVSSSLVRDSQDRIRYYISLFQDITPRKQVEEALRQREERYREFVEGTDNLVTQVDSRGIFTFVNHTARKVFGLAPGACVGRSAFDFIHPDDREETRKAFTGWVRNKVSNVTFENRQVSRSGEVSHMLWTINFNYDDQGEISNINSIARDITEHKQMEKELRENTQHLEKVNKALKSMLDHREVEKRAVEESMLINLKKFVFPYLEKMEEIKCGSECETYQNIIKTNLKDLVAPISKNLSSKYLDFTPTEIKISDLIRLGKRTKEISNILNMAPSSVSWYRKNIRKKLGLLNTKTNLGTYLNSLS